MVRKHYIIVIPAGIKDELNAWIEKEWSDVGKDNLKVELNATGNLDKSATNVWAGWFLSDERKVALEEQIKSRVGNSYYFKLSSENQPHEVLTDLNLKRREFEDRWG